ncbi:hypothetical protein D3C73_1201910 [compost metagenome]
MPGFLHTMRNNGKIVATYLGKHHSGRQYRLEFFDNRQQQDFPLSFAQHACGIPQRFAGDNHQCCGLLTGYNLLQQPH